MRWTFNKIEVTGIENIPDNAFGFIYKITNITKNKFYIGSKFLFYNRNKPISKKKYDELKKNGAEVTKSKSKKTDKSGKIIWIYKQKNVKSETDWEKYTGSNDVLNKDIKNGDKYIKEIICYTYNKKDHTFLEIEQIIKYNCLHDCSSYNSNILGKIFKQTKCDEI